MPYIIIPLIPLFLLYFMNSGGAKKADLEYYQVIELFDKGEVTKYNLNIGSGALTYELKDGTTAKYSVPNVSLFIEDIHDSVVEYNRENPKTPIKYNYVSGASGSLVLQLLPGVFGIILVIVLGYFFMKKMNN